MKIRHHCVIIFIILAYGAALYGARETVRNSITYSGKGLSLFNVEMIRKGGSDLFRVRDISYGGNTDALITDMIVSFKQGANEIHTDDTGRYPVLHAAYTLVRDDASSGGTSGQFYKQDDRIELSARENLWLSGRGDLGSFTIEMKLNPSSIREGGVLFSRIGFASGGKNGIEIAIRNGRICALLYGIFTDDSGRRITKILKRGARIETGKWQHYALSYDRITGKLAQFVDGNEEEAIFVTASGRAGEGVYAPSFPAGDLPRGVIGKGFYGKLDEFKISYRHYEDLRNVADSAERRFRDLRMSGRTPINKEGTITSDVEKFPYSGTMITLFAWDENKIPETFAWFEIRTSDKLFMPDDTRIKWYRIENNQRSIYLQKTDDGFLRGKYIQWRGHLVPSPDGARSPEIGKIRMNYELDTAPEEPIFVKAVSAGDGKIILSWKKNVDFDLYGYKIYYGVKPGKFDGVLRRVNGVPITNSLSKTNIMNLQIDNNLIEENRNIDSGMVLEYPVMKNNVLYYFAVTAYDSYKVDTQFNHESKHSEMVSARPFAGSEIQPR
jgi:hypothetical protein